MEYMYWAGSVRNDAFSGRKLSTERHLSQALPSSCAPFKVFVLQKGIECQRDTPLSSCKLAKGWRTGQASKFYAEHVSPPWRHFISFSFSLVLCVSIPLFSSQFFAFVVTFVFPFTQSVEDLLSYVFNCIVFLCNTNCGSYAVFWRPAWGFNYLWAQWATTVNNTN